MRTKNKLSWIILLMAIFGIGISFSISQSKYLRTEMPIVSTSKFLTPSATRSSKCAPIPWLAENNNAITSTPNRHGTPSPNKNNIYKTATPENIASVVDLSPNISNNLKIEVFVFRCNGTIVKYLVDPNQFQNTTITGIISMEDGDIIMRTNMNVDVLSRRPPTAALIVRPTPFATTISVPLQNTTTPQPYPPPENAISSPVKNPTLTTQPYPAP